MGTATITSSKIEIRAVIRCLWLKNYKPVQTHGKVCEVYGEKTISRYAVEKWCNTFKNGRTDINDDYRAGRPSTATTIDNVVRVNEIKQSNRRVTVDEIAETIGISFGSAHEIITERLEYHKVCAR